MTIVSSWRVLYGVTTNTIQRTRVLRRYYLGFPWRNRDGRRRLLPIGNRKHASRRVSICVSCSVDELTEIDARAAAAGLERSRFLVLRALS